MSVESNLGLLFLIFFALIRSAIGPEIRITLSTNQMQYYNQPWLSRSRFPAL